MRPEKVCVAALLMLVAPLSARAQPGEWNDRGRDTTLLYAVYALDHPAVTVPLKLVNVTAYPTFLLIPVGLYTSGGEIRPAARALVSEVGAGVLMLGLKRLVKRPRPYAIRHGIVLRSDAADRAVLKRDDYGFPSGHTTLAFAAATSVSLSHPRWYVAVPALGWATTMGISRIWHGAHYPSDVAAGAALGFVVAGAMHVLWPDSPEQSEGAFVPFTVRIAF